MLYDAMLAATMTTTTTKQEEMMVNAVKMDDAGFVKQHLKIQEINRVWDHMGNTLLHLSVIYNSAQVMKYLLKIDVKDDIKNDAGDTARMLACRYGQLVLFDLQLLEFRDIFEKITGENERLTKQQKLLEKEQEEQLVELSRCKDRVGHLKTKVVTLEKEKEEMMNESRQSKRQLEFYKESYVRLMKRMKTAP